MSDASIDRKKVSRMPRKKRKNVVDPTVSSDEESATSELSLRRSNVFNSMESLTPSQLDHAIMEMLNIKPKAGIAGICDANPITRMGKRIQLAQMLGLVLIPIVVLLGLSANLFVAKLIAQQQTSGIAGTMRYSVEISKLIDSLQKERDMSALYISSIRPATKEFLVERYPITDKDIERLSAWNVDTSSKDKNYQTMEAFLTLLNKHRYELDTQPHTSKDELIFYSNIIKTLMEYFYEALTEAQSGSVWKELVSLVEILEAKEAFGIERAYGVIFHTKGGFENINDYLTFVQAQDIATHTLGNARSYSSLAEEIYKKSIREEVDDESFFTTISEMRRYLRRAPLIEATDNVDDSLQNATWWYGNMTFYLDVFLQIQRSLSTRVIEIVDQQELDVQTTLISLAVLFGIVLFFCPLIINAVYVHTAEIQNYSITLAERTKALNKEKTRTNILLYQMLPKSIAEQLKKNEAVTTENFEEATIFFSDIVSFTIISSRSSPIQVVQMLNILYTAFDDRIALYDVYKVETIGDGYMVASGLPHRNGRRHAPEIATLALDLLDRIQMIEIPHMPGSTFRLRIGCHTGSVVAGIVGNKMPRYCLLGITVVIASQMESSGKSGKIQVSETTRKILEEMEGYVMEERVDELSKSLPVQTYWLLHKEGMRRKIKKNLTDIEDDPNYRSLSDAESEFITAKLDEDLAAAAAIAAKVEEEVVVVEPPPANAKVKDFHEKNPYRK